MIAFYQLQPFTGLRVVNSIPYIEIQADTHMSIVDNRIKISGQQSNVIHTIQLLQQQHEQYWQVSRFFHNRQFHKARKLHSFNFIDVSKFGIDTVKQTIGRKGFHFINITETYGLNAIWHNRAYNTIELWGDNIAAFQATQHLITTLHHFHHTLS